MRDGEQCLPDKSLSRIADAIFEKRLQLRAD
jgi:hypothetical protein